MPTFSRPQPLTHGPTDLRANWSPDGAWIVFERLQHGRRRLWRVQPDGSGEQPLNLDDPAESQTTGRPAFFTPDDFVFVSDRAGRPALYRTRAGEITLLHGAAQPCYGPALGATGRWPLLFFQQDGESSTHIHALHEHGQREQLTVQPGVQDQPWPLPDGSFVYHALEGGQHLVCRQLLVTGHAPVRLSESDEGTAYVTPFPAPDGSWVAFTSARSGQEEVWVMRPDGTERQQITHGGPHSFPAWSPDGRSLVCTQGQPTAEAPSGQLVVLAVS